MSEWEYCSIWTDYRKVMLISDESYLLFEHWSPNPNNKPIPLDGALYPKIAQLGFENWEMVENRENTVEYGENTPSRTYSYLLFRRSVRREIMNKWEYCRIYHVTFPKKTISIYMDVKCVIEYFKPDGKNVIQDATSHNVHSVAASLALDGWEIVKWQPPTLESKQADYTGDILMKKAVS